MDTDTLFLTSPTFVWEHFKQMNQFQIAAVAPEHEDYSTGWYNRFARHPYYGNLGMIAVLITIDLLSTAGSSLNRNQFRSHVDEFDANESFRLGKVCSSHLSGVQIQNYMGRSRHN